MELPLTPSARPRRASRRSSGGAYGTSPITGRRRLRGASLRDGGGGAYGTSLLTGRSADYGRRLRDEPPYGPEALTGRASLRTEALTGRASLYTGRPSLRGGTQGRASSPSRAGSAYGTSLLTEALTGRASLGAYGASLFTGPNYEPLYGTLTARLRPGAP